MSRTRQMVVGLVGHCGADASYLRIAVTASAPGSRVVVFHDEADLYTSLGAAELDLVLLNRRVDYGFEVTDGVELVRQIKARRPQQRVIMVSNFAETQAAAEAAGALPGFGKREIGSARVKERLAAALASDDAEVTLSKTSG